MPPKNKDKRGTIKRARSDSTESQSGVDNEPPLLAVEYAGRKVVIKASTSYENTITSIKKGFDELQQVPNHQIQLFVKLEKVDDLAQVVEGLWTEVMPSLSLIKVVMGDLPAISTKASPAKSIKVYIFAISGITKAFKVASSCIVARLKILIVEGFPGGIPDEEFVLYYHGTLMADEDTLAHYGVKDGEVIDLGYALLRDL
ncbi:hypothetical protein B0J17DRAFT_722027 [Rhizoctonia solani]|nr:hypothetical protein B0J17DRAFT_722027 [Rhizoctonia solani]